VYHRRRAGRHDHPRDARRCRQTRGEARDPAGAYTNEAVALRLDDGDSSPLASARLGALRPWAGSGKVRRYRARGPGVKTVLLRDLGPRRPGRFQLTVLAARWFTAAAANQRAADTLLTVTIGAECVRHAATKKVD